MSEVWHARVGIVARGCARGRIRSRRPGPGGGGVAAAGGAAGPALAAGGGSARWPAWSRSRCARSPRPGNDRLTAVGQWIRRASQADLARLRAPWDPMAGRYRAPDEKTIRVVLDRLDPRALAQACSGPARAAPGFTCSVPPSTAGGCWITSRSMSSTTRPAISPSCWDRWTSMAVVTFDALHTVRANLDWLVTDKKAHYIAVVKKNQPLLHARIKALPWRQVPAGITTREAGHGRIETRTLKAAHVSRLDFAHARQAIKITRRRQDTATGRTTRQTVYAVTSLTSAHATAPDLARLVREHWSIGTSPHQGHDV